MKSLKNIKKELTPKETAASLIFPNDMSPRQKEAFLEAFREHRKKSSARQSEKTKLIAQLLQLKFLIEDYIISDKLNKDLHFGYFLKEYIQRLEKKNKDFAQEIDVDPAELSQVINRHRKPTEKLIFRLEIHSNRNFPAILWFKILEKERADELQYNKHIIDVEKKHVKQKLEFSF